MSNLLQIRSLSASVDDKVILNNLSLTVNQGETHIIMGPNGAGKSTLANVIMGHPKYTVLSGDILFEGENINELSTTERARKKIFLSFQVPEEVPGVHLENFIRRAKANYEQKNLSVLSFGRSLRKNMALLNMDPSYLDRHLNVGFSGGEKKKSEILQMITLDPKLAILDETDSGLDIDAVKVVSKGINLYKNANNSIIIITHNPHFLKEIKPDKVHVLAQGTIIKSGGEELVEEISTQGFDRMLE